ncbi:MAG: hypothetical protein Kow0088_14060 [Anaerolineales bacterium]
MQVCAREDKAGGIGNHNLFSLNRKGRRRLYSLLTDIGNRKEELEEKTPIRDC